MGGTAGNFLESAKLALLKNPFLYRVCQIKDESIFCVWKFILHPLKPCLLSGDEQGTVGCCYDNGATMTTGPHRFWQQLTTLNIWCWNNYLFFHHSPHWTLVGHCPLSQLRFQKSRVYPLQLILLRPELSVSLMSKPTKFARIEQSSGDAPNNSIVVNLDTATRGYNPERPNVYYPETRYSDVGKSRSVTGISKTYRRTIPREHNYLCEYRGGPQHMMTKSSRARGRRYGLRENGHQSDAARGMQTANQRPLSERSAVPVTITIENSNRKTAAATSLKPSSYASVLKPGLIEVTTAIKNMIFGKNLVMDTALLGLQRQGPTSQAWLVQHMSTSFRSKTLSQIFILVFGSSPCN